MLVLLLLNLVNTQAQTPAPGKCIPLAASKNCKELSQYSIEAFDQVKTVEAFDSYIDAQSAFNYGSLCPNWATAKGFPIRYASSMACGFAVFSTTARKVCNQDLPPPKTLCKSTLDLMFEDVQTQLTKSCPTVKIFKGYLDYQSPLSDSNCLIAIGNDVQKKCGVDEAASDAFCKANPTKLCCTSAANELGAGGKTVGGATPAPAQTNTADQKSINTDAPTGINPLFIGAAAIGVSLIIIMVSALFVMTRKSKSEPNNYSQNYSQPKEAIMQNQERQRPPAPQQFQRPQSEQRQKTEVEEEETMEVVFEYAANLFDELTLNVGDEVEIFDRFDDGWALGYNITTEKQGTFPLACLAPFGTASEYRESQYSASTKQSKRISSMWVYSEGNPSRYSAATDQ